MFCTVLTVETCGPKFSKEGIEEFIISNTLEEVFDYVVKEHLYLDADELQEESSAYVLKSEKLENPARFNLTVDEEDWYSTIDYSGTKKNLLEAFRTSKIFKQDDGYYYGVYYYTWSNSTQITDNELLFLKNTLQLPIKDIRNETQESR